MRAPTKSTPRKIDIKKPPGWYEIDAYANLFQVVAGNTDVLAVFRKEFNRLGRIAGLRAERDDIELPQARRDVSELLEVLLTVQPKLRKMAELRDRLSEVKTERTEGEIDKGVGDSAVAAAKLSLVFKQKQLSAKPLHSVNGYLVKIFEASQDLREWSESFEQEYEPMPSPRGAQPRDLKLLFKHLVRLVVEFYRFRLCGLPPANRNHWLGEFMVALSHDFELPSIEGKDDVEMAFYFGGKIEEVLHSMKTEDFQS
jgi:hypothetical protein